MRAILIWLFLGCTLVVAAFAFPGISMELWPNINHAGIVASMYLIALVAYTMRNPFSPRVRRIVWGIFLLVSISTFTAWTTMDRQSHFQKDSLIRVRDILKDQEFVSEMYEPLLKVLKEYYKHPLYSKASLKEIFLQQHPQDSIGSNISKFPSSHDSSRIYLASLSDSAIVLIGEYINIHAVGRNSSYNNYDGHIGLLQRRAILTARGITYEHDN